MKMNSQYPHLTDEEVQEITERVTAQVTERVTAQVTEQITDRFLCTAVSQGELSLRWAAGITNQSEEQFVRHMADSGYSVPAQYQHYLTGV